MDLDTFIQRLLALPVVEETGALTPESVAHLLRLPIEAVLAFLDAPEFSALYQKGMDRLIRLNQPLLMKAAVADRDAKAFTALAAQCGTTKPQAQAIEVIFNPVPKASDETGT